jgi:hypothetical protein
VDPDTIIFYEPSTGGNIQDTFESGFDSGPGGKVRMSEEQRRTEDWSEATAAASTCVTMRSSLILLQHYN